MSKDMSKEDVKKTISPLYARQLEIVKASVVAPEVFVALITAEILRPCETFGCNCFMLTPRGYEIVISELNRLAAMENPVD